jgi:hypothetical protein
MRFIQQLRIKIDSEPLLKCATKVATIRQSSIHFLYLLCRQLLYPRSVVERLRHNLTRCTVSLQLNKHQRTIWSYSQQVATATVGCRQRPPNEISPEENEAQESEADRLALQWINDYLKERNIPDIPPLTREEIERAQARNRELMTRGRR